MSWVSCTHHVLGVEHLLGKLWHGKCSILLGASGRQWCKTGHKEMKTWEWDQIYGKLSQIRV